MNFERLLELLPWLLPFAGAISGAVAWVLTYRNREAIVEAQAVKTSAETDAMASTEWKRLYDEMGRRLDTAEDKIKRVETDLDIAKDYIQYLWLGTFENIHYMQKEGLEPPFQPKRSFRGDDEDFDDAEWAWLGDLGSK